MTYRITGGFLFSVKVATLMSLLKEFSKLKSNFKGAGKTLSLIISSTKKQKIVKTINACTISRIVCRGQEGPKGGKGNVRPDFQANTIADLGFF
jgi:hypothetical protein